MAISTQFSLTENMDFESALAWLKSFVSHEDMSDVSYDGDSFSVERVRKFLDDFGVDFERLKFVHVAGSKGKGSVCDLIARYLNEAGFRVGMFTSPYMLSVCECFWANGELIDEDDFVEYVECLRDFLRDYDGEELTYFEYLTVLVLKYFVDEGLEYAVLEVGMGGRLDATNVVMPEVAVLNTVELEHVGILGDTLEEILNEKLGIVKVGVPLFVGKQSMEVCSMILARFPEAVFVEMENGVDECNRNLAFMVLERLLGGVDEGIWNEVCKGPGLAGRFDIRDGVVFDMAHTLWSMEALLERLEGEFVGKDFVFLMSFMKDKDVRGLLSLVEEFLEERGGRIVLTDCHAERGFDASEFGEFKYESDCLRAFEGLKRDLKKDQVLVVTGSHFLISKIYLALNKL